MWSVGAESNRLPPRPRRGALTVALPTGGGMVGWWRGRRLGGGAVREWERARGGHLAGLASNVQVRGLSALELVRELRELVDEGWGEAELVRALGKGERWVRLWLGIARLPDRLVERIGGP